MTKLKSVPRRTLSILLCMVMMLTIFMSVPITASAGTASDNIVKTSNKIVVGRTERVNEVVCANEVQKSEMADTSYSMTKENDYEKIEKDGVIYSLDEYNELYITGVHKDLLPENLIIPKEINGYPVVRIMRRVFINADNLKSVFIPNSIHTAIDDSTFEDCTNLKSVVFEDGIKINALGDSAFLRCTSLESIYIPASVETIANFAFGSCLNLKKVTFGENSKLKYIDMGTFHGCETLQSIDIPSSCKRIYDGAFSHCHSLSEVTLREGLKEIMEGTFLNCYSLSQIYIPESVETIEFAALGCYEENANYYAFTNFTVIGTLDSLADEYADAYGMKYALPAPKLSSVKNTTDGVKISFKKLSGVSGKYRVYRKTSGSSWKKLADVTGTSYVDKTAVSGKKYTYTVKFIGNPANSVYDKNGLSIVRLSTPSVSKITNVNEGAKLSIKGVDGASKYTVFVKSGSSWKKLGDTTTTTFVHENLNSGTTYTYTVKSYDASLVYASAYNSTGFKNKFVAPPVISKLSNTESGVKITWGKVSGAEKYRVFVKSGSKWKKLTDTAKTSFTHTAVESGKTYTYTVRCISESGKSYKSGYDTKGTSTMFLATPKVKKISNTVDGAKITWNEVDGAYKYNIYVKSGSSWKKLGESNTTSFVHESAKSGTSYSYRVRAYDETAEFSSYYKTSNKNTFIGAPVISSLTSTNSGVKIAWGKVNGAAKYRVFVKSGSSWKKLKDTTSTSFVHKNVQSGSSYTYTVRCISESGKSYTSGYDTTGQTIIFE